MRFRPLVLLSRRTRVMITDESGAYLPPPHVTKWAGLKAATQLFPFIIIGGMIR